MGRMARGGLYFREGKYRAAGFCGAPRFAGNRPFGQKTAFSFTQPTAPGSEAARPQPTSQKRPRTSKEPSRARAAPLHQNGRQSDAEGYSPKMRFRTISEAEATIFAHGRVA